MKWFVPGWFRQFRQNWGLWQTKNGLRRPHMDPKDNAHKYGLGQYLLHMSWSPNFSGGIRQRLLFFSVLAMFNCARGFSPKSAVSCWKYLMYPKKIHGSWITIGTLGHHKLQKNWMILGSPRIQESPLESTWLLLDPPRWWSMVKPVGCNHMADSTPPFFVEITRNNQFLLVLELDIPSKWVRGTDDVYFLTALSI